MSHLKLHVTLHTWQSSHFTLHSSHCTLRSQHFTSHCTLKTPHFTLHTPHCTLRTRNFTLHSPHFTLHTPHFALHSSRPFSLHSSHFTLHTSLFTPHTSHCTLHTPHFISSDLFSPYPSWALLISSLLICHLSFHESLPSTTTKKLACAVRQPGRARVLCAKLLQCCCPRCRAKQKKDDFDALFKRIFKRKITNAKIAKICWDNHYRSLDAATPIRFTMFSCNRQ